MYGHPVTPPKRRWKSKTYWANGMAIALMALEANLHFLQPLLPVNVYLLAVFLIPFMNFILREFTDRGVGNPPRVGPPPTPWLPGRPYGAQKAADPDE